jgi:DNA primase
LEDLSVFIPDEKVSEIRETCSIVQVISGYVSLTKSGNSYRGLCPFHQEKTPSFFVSEAKKIFHCFGCGESGDVFAFIMKQEKLGFQSAARLLANRFGIALPERQMTAQQRRQLTEREEAYAINEAAARYYHDTLLSDPRGKKARAYLHDRGISAASIKAFRLGFAPDGWQELRNYLRGQKLSLEAAQKAGLLIPKEKGQHYDRFRQRIIFPIVNLAGHIIGFGGRVLDAGEPKYLNSPESFIYNKRQNLYGLNSAARFIAQQNAAILVEGYFDLISLQQAGINHAVAPLGTALTEQQILILKRYTPNIITVFDADSAGEKAMIRSLTPFLASGISPRMILLPAGHDPDSYVRQHGAQPFTELTAGAVPLLDFVLEQTIQKHDITTPRGKISASEDLIPVLQKITNELERDLYIQKAAALLGIKEAYLINRIGKASGSDAGLSPDSVARAAGAEEPAAIEEKAERLILELMVLHPEVIAAVEEHAVFEEFTSGALREAGRTLCRRYHEQGEIRLPEIISMIQDDATRQYVTEVSFKEGCGGNPFKMLEDCIQKIRLQKLRQQREATRALLKKAEARRDEASCQQFQIHYQQLIEEEKRIHQFRIIT